VKASAIIQLLNHAFSIFLEVVRIKKRKDFDKKVDEIHHDPGKYFDDKYGVPDDYKQYLPSQSEKLKQGED
jgi:hypothetical protein